MDYHAIISAALTLCALLVEALLLVATVLDGKLQERIYRWFFLVVGGSILAICCDIISGLLMGTGSPTLGMVLRVADALAYILTSVQIVGFALYMREVLLAKGQGMEKAFRVQLFLGAACFAVSCIAPFVGLYARFDQWNQYHIQPFYWVSLLFSVLNFSVCIAVSIKYRALLTRREFLSFFLYAMIPTLCFVIEVLVPGLWLAFFGVAVAQFIVYVNIQANLKNQLTQAQIAVMLSQIQPHFLYNTLNVIDDLFYHDQDRAHRAMYSFSAFLRSNMDSLTQKDRIFFSKELEHTRNYLWLEQLRFEERLQIHYDIQAEHFTLPVLTLQPLVENAVRHGIMQKPSGGTLTIGTEETDGCFRITVSDDGVGFDANGPVPDDRNHNGIANVRSRLAALCDGTLRVTGIPGEGTTAVIEIPKKGGAKG